MSNLVVTAVGAQKYSFTDKNTGRLVEGITVYYLQSASFDDVVGSIPQKISISDISQWQNISSLKYPARVQVLTEQALGKKGVYSKTVGIKTI